MTDLDRAAVERAMAGLAHRHPGPGGVAGVVMAGAVVAATAWGHADLAARREMTVATRLPLCSITKQFTCGALLASLGSPEALDPALPALLPDYQGPLPSVRELCNNQSGLRDYWALTVLLGARAEQEFRHSDARPVLARIRRGHFTPGTRYSYANGNFRLLSDLLEEATGQEIAALYSRHIWGPAGMAGAMLAADTRTPPDRVTGYEGGLATGWWPAANGIWWQGDAGAAASLNDMLAYEIWADAGRDDAGALYTRLAAPQQFRDGTAATYGFGLSSFELGGHRFTAHGGALRGFRAYRAYSPTARLSVVVMLNHDGSAQGAALDLLRAALGEAAPAPAGPVPDWAAGQWQCPETGLLVRLVPQGDGVALHFGVSPEILLPQADGSLLAGTVRVSRDGAAIRMTRATENYAATLIPVAAAPPGDAADLVGRWVCDELDAEMEITANGPGLAAGFSGLLGRGPAELVAPAGPDLWRVQTRRSMDAPAPGDWTLQLHRDSSGVVTGARLGCWLARGLDYRKVS